MEKITPWIDPADKYGAVGVRFTNSILVLCISELRAPGNDARKLMDWFLQFLVLESIIEERWFLVSQPHHSSVPIFPFGRSLFQHTVRQEHIQRLLNHQVPLLLSNQSILMNSFWGCKSRKEIIMELWMKKTHFVKVYIWILHVTFCFDLFIHIF